jgi:TolA-binding protein
MKTNRNFVLTIIAIVSTFMLFSCSQNKEADLKKVTDLEKKYGASAYSDLSKAKELIASYDEFVKKYPKDTVSARFLFEAGRLSMNTAQGKDAVKYFDKVITDFPDYSKTPDCMFLKGFVYDDLLKDFAKAKEAYQAFLAKYPTHEFADDAKASIENLGKTPEQLIKEFEAKNGVDSLQAKK